MASRSRSLFAAGLLLAAGLAAPAHAQAVAAPATNQDRPPAPATRLGNLIRATRAESFVNEVVGLTAETKADRNRIYVILEFEGPNTAEEALKSLRQQAAGFGGGAIKNLYDTQSSLVDAKGAKYTGTLAVVRSSQCKLVFSVPKTATGLVWHDGETKRYQLEPFPKELVP